jgi:hypothetical protein
MNDCVIRANRKRALTVTKGARVTLRNCLLAAPVGQASSLPSAPNSQAGRLRHEHQPITTGVNVNGDNTRLEIGRCTLYGFAVGLDARITASNRLKVHRTAWLRCRVNTHIRTVQAAEDPPVVLTDCLDLGGNQYEPAPWQVVSQRQTAIGGGWKTDQRTFTAGEYGTFAVLTGSDRDGVTASIDAPDPMTLPPLSTSDGEAVGARILQPMTVGARSSH